MIINMSGYYLRTQQWHGGGGDTPLQDLNGYVPPNGVIIFQLVIYIYGLNIETSRSFLKKISSDFNLLLEKHY